MLDVDRCLSSNNNSGMQVSGRVQNGVVVFEQPNALPDGAAVVVTYREKPVIRFSDNPRPVVLPIFDSDQPGTLDLTNDQIADILDQEDASS